MPRLGLAARGGVSPAWARGAFRLGLLDPTRTRRESSRRPDRTEPRTSPTFTRGRRCTCQAPDGSAWTRRRGSSRAKGTFPWRLRQVRSWRRLSRGSSDRVSVEFHHEMSVTRIHEDPRVTKPYSDSQWQDIVALGDRVDQELAAGDVRLTMGGEPTFVSIDDMDGDEWNTAAMGPGKRRLGGTLLSRLRETFAPGGLLHFGQGKWYPGESLPRWAFSCYWRTDGKPLWQDMTLVADLERDYGFGTDEAQSFAEALADRLSVGRAHVIAAYEDPLAYVHKERQLPFNVDPEHNTLDDPEERERLRRVFSRGLGTPTGFVLPLARVQLKDGPAWQSGLWMLRAKHLFLVPGDSPVGFRLPMESLPAGRSFDVFPSDPLSTWPPLGDTTRVLAAEERLASRIVTHRPSPRHGRTATRFRHRRSRRAAAGTTRTAVTVRNDSRRPARPYRAHGRSTRRQALRVSPSCGVGERLRRALGCRGGHGRASRRARPGGGLPSTLRPASQAHQGHAGSRRD